MDKIIQNLQDTHPVQWKYFPSLIYQGMLYIYGLWLLTVDERVVPLH